MDINIHNVITFYVEFVLLVSIGYASSGKTFCLRKKSFFFICALSTKEIIFLSFSSLESLVLYLCSLILVSWNNLSCIEQYVDSAKSIGQVKVKK